MNTSWLHAIQKLLKARTMDRISAKSLAKTPSLTSGNASVSMKVLKEQISSSENKMIAGQQVIIGGQQVIIGGQQGIKAQLETVQESLNNLTTICQTGFDELGQDIKQTFQLIVNMQESATPRMVVMKKGSKSAAGKGFSARLEKLGKNMMTAVGWSEYVTLTILDESAFLAPDLFAHPLPVHDGFEMKMPGKVLKAIAPILYVTVMLIKAGGAVATGMNSEQRTLYSVRCVTIYFIVVRTIVNNFVVCRISLCLDAVRMSLHQYYAVYSCVIIEPS